METTETIAAWADEAFGPAPSMARVAARANEEMAELLRAATVAEDRFDTDWAQLEIAREAADVVIVLQRIFAQCGTTMEAEVDRKMAINRGRAWKPDGTGHGYHVRDGE